MQKDTSVRRSRRFGGWAGAIVALALLGGVGIRTAYTQGTTPPASPLSDDWKGDKLDTTRWHVTVMGDAQDQENSYTVQNGLLHLKAGGSDIWGNGDNGLYLWQPANGDFQVTLEIHNIQRTDASAKVGVMVRTSLDKFSPNVFMQAMPKGGNMQVRQPGVDISGDDTGPGSSCPGDECVKWGDPDNEDPNRPVILQRLTRTGKSFKAERSYDGGKTWGGLHSGSLATQD
jgi:hypothetical protein